VDKIQVLVPPVHKDIMSVMVFVLIVLQYVLIVLHKINVFLVLMDTFNLMESVHSAYCFVNFVKTLILVKNANNIFF